MPEDFSLASHTDRQTAAVRIGEGNAGKKEEEASVISVDKTFQRKKKRGMSAVTCCLDPAFKLGSFVASFWDSPELSAPSGVIAVERLRVRVMPPFRDGPPPVTDVEL